MERLPIKWVERIWERLECIYKQKWVERYGNEKLRPLLLTQWCVGLSGLTAREIQTAIMMLECSRRDFPPTVVEFFHYAKRIKQPPMPSKGVPTWTAGNPDVAKGYLHEIRSRLK